MSDASPASDASSVEFRVSHAHRDASETALAGRLLVIVASAETPEPRFQVSDGARTAQVFGLDVEDFAAGAAVTVGTVGTQAYGYPLASPADLPPGDYYVQAVLNRYRRFRPVHGHELWLPPERGEGQQWNRKPGNLVSRPVALHVEAGGSATVELALTEVLPPLPTPADTRYVKHVTFESELLSAFWNEPVELGAHVLLPEGFDEHPAARYPLCIFHGHFPSDFGGFRPEPPDPDLEPDFSARFGVEGYNKIQQQVAHDFYEAWTGPDFPRVIIVEIQHANPFYDDSYAVNSQNLGPYGDALTYEFIPWLEERFRGIGQGWARFLYGGSTGGWEALAAQVYYPDEYNGCFAACPDPIDFRAYCLVDLYADANAYWTQGPFQSIERPAHRDWLGRVTSTVRTQNLMELALGSHGRSGGQWDIWQAVYSPVGPDGYPAPIWDKESGVIDPDVASYWREHYDLRHILERDWHELGPKLAGKLHIYCGDMDNYYLNDAVYLMESFLESTTEPYYAGEVLYGDRAEHCWNGDPERPNHLSRLRYNEMYLPKILARIAATAPEGADLESWRY